MFANPQRNSSLKFSEQNLPEGDPFGVFEGITYSKELYEIIKEELCFVENVSLFNLYYYIKSFLIIQGSKGNSDKEHLEEHNGLFPGSILQ